MRSSRVALAAFAAGMCVFAAGQAGAVTKLVFEITTGDPVLGTFQQTWTLGDDGVGIVNTLNDPTILYGYVGTAAASNSPIAGDLLAQTHVTSYNLTSFDYTRGIDLTDEANGSLGFFLSQGGEATFDVTSTQYTQAYYSVSIMGGSYGLTGVPAAVPTMADLIAYAGDDDVYFIWSEQVSASRLRLRDDKYLGDLFNTSYSGRARLISVDDGSGTGGGAVVPEPAAWALMVLGFGAVGVGVRRRGLAALR